MLFQISSPGSSSYALIQRPRPRWVIGFAAAIALLPASGSQALEIGWSSDADGNWNQATNWDLAVPASGDDVTIDRAAADVVVTHDAGASAINSLLLRETLSIVSGSTLSTASLTSLVGATIQSDGPGSSFSSTGATSVDETNLRATNGALLDLAQATGFATGGRQKTILSEGIASRIDLSGALELRGATINSNELLVNATSGGTVDLSRLTEVLDGSARFTADGPGSLIDLQEVSRFTDTGALRDISRLEARNGGTVALNTSTPVSITGYEITRDGASSTLDTSAVETLVGSRVTAIGAGTTLDLSSLTSADGNSFSALGGASLTLETTSYTAGEAETLRAEGASSTLDLSRIQTLAGATRARIIADATAEDGGRIDLSGATSLADSSLRFRALGQGSVIDVSNLESFVDTGEVRDRSELAARDGGALLLNTSTPLTITGYDLVREGATSTLDLTQLTALADSSVTAIGVGAGLNLSGLTRFDGNSFAAEDGALLTLSSTAYDSLDSARFLRAEGAGSSLDASSWQSLTAPTRQSTLLTVEALDGGSIDLSGLTSLSDGSVRFTADGAGSLLDLSALDELVDSGGTRDRSALAARDGATVLLGDPSRSLTITGYDLVREGGASTLDLSHLTSLVDSSVTSIGAGAGFDLSGLSSFNGNSFAAEEGATLTLETARYENESDRRSLEAEGAQSLLDASSLESLAGGMGAGQTLTVRAADGGTVDLNRVTTVDDSTVRFISDGANSLILLEGVTQFVDTVSGSNEFSSLEARNGGEVRLGPGVSEVRGFELVVEDAGSLLELGGVTELTDSSVLLQGVGAAIDLSSISGYDTNSFEARDGALFQLDTSDYASGDETRDFIARGTQAGNASTLDGSQLRSLVGGTGPTSALRVSALSGGFVDLSGVVDLADSATRFVAEGNGSVVDLSGLDQFVDTVSSGNNFSLIEARSGGRVVLGDTQPITIDGYSIQLTGATSSIDTGALANLTNSEVTTNGVGASLDLSGLTNVDGNSFTALGGSALTLGANTYTTGGVTQRLQARGAGSRLDASGVQTLEGGSGTATLRIDASTGGFVDLSGAGSLGGGNFAFLADGAGSVLDLSGIDRFEGDGGPIRSSLSALGGGAIEFGGTGSAIIDDYDLEVAGNGSLLDLTGVDRLTNSKVTANGPGATVDLSSVASLDGNSFFAENGATLELSTADYDGTGARWQSIGASGATPSLLDATSLARLSGSQDAGGALRVLSLLGGQMDLSNVNQIEGAVILEVDGAGSSVDLSGLTSWNDDVVGQFSSQVVVRDGASLTLGEIDVDWSGVNLTLRNAELTGGRLSLTGDVVLNAEGNLDLDILLEDARFVVGGNTAGTTRINGDYEQTLATIMQIGLGGDSAGEFDLLEIAGSAMLAGTIEARLIAVGSGNTLFDPQIGATFDVLTAAQITDMGFDTTSFGFSDGRFFQSEIVAGGIGELLRLTVVVPEPSTALLLGLGLASLARRRA